MRILSLLFKCGLLFFINKQPLTAQSKLVLNGAYIKLNGGTNANPIYLVVEDSASNAVTRNSGHIISEAEHNFLKRNQGTNQLAFLYPFGVSTTDYIPFTYTKTNASSVKLAFSTWATNNHNNPHPLGVVQMQGAGDSLTSAIDRFWNMEADNTSSGDFTFSYRGFENTTTSPTTSTFSAQYWDGRNWSAAPIGGSNGLTAGIGTTTLLFSMSPGTFPFVLVRSGFPLPADLIDFKANWVNEHKKNAILNWTTASEYNTSHFQIERSLDGINYDSIGSIPAQGNSLILTNYMLEDDVAVFSQNTFFYRLKIYDLNQSYELSEIQILARSASQPVSVILFPNPFKNKIQLNFNMNLKSRINLRMIDNQGKLVYSANQASLKNNSYTLNINSMARGTYLLILTINRESHTFKIIKN